MGEQTYIHFADVTGDGLDDMIDVGAKYCFSLAIRWVRLPREPRLDTGAVPRGLGVGPIPLPTSREMAKLILLFATIDRTVVRPSTGSAFRAPETLDKRQVYDKNLCRRQRGPQSRCYLNARGTESPLFGYPMDQSFFLNKTGPEARSLRFIRIMQTSPGMAWRMRLA
jgi:hypothetical protein